MLAGDQLWFSSGAQAKARPEPRADSGFLLQLAERADAVAAILDAAAQSALRFEPPLAGARRRGREPLRRARGGAAERSAHARPSFGGPRRRRGRQLSAIAVEAAGLTREREDVLARLPEGGEAEALTDEEVDELRAQIERLERRRETLGQVNPLAAEEHAREKERLEELTTQREDLERSLEELDEAPRRPDRNGRAALRGDLRRSRAPFRRGGRHALPRRDGEARPPRR